MPDQDIFTKALTQSATPPAKAAPAVDNPFTNILKGNTPASAPKKAPVKAAPKPKSQPTDADIRKSDKPGTKYTTLTATQARNIAAPASLFAGGPKPHEPNSHEREDQARKDMDVKSRVDKLGFTTEALRKAIADESGTVPYKDGSHIPVRVASKAYANAIHSNGEFNTGESQSSINERRDLEGEHEAIKNTHWNFLPNVGPSPNDKVAASRTLSKASHHLVDQLGVALHNWEPGWYEDDPYNEDSKKGLDAIINTAGLFVSPIRMMQGFEMLNNAYNTVDQKGLGEGAKELAQGVAQQFNPTQLGEQYGLAEPNQTPTERITHGLNALLAGYAGFTGAKAIPDKLGKGRPDVTPDTTDIQGLANYLGSKNASAHLSGSLDRVYGGVNLQQAVKNPIYGLPAEYQPSRTEMGLPSTRLGAAGFPKPNANDLAMMKGLKDSANKARAKGDHVRAQQYQDAHDQYAAQFHPPVPPQSKPSAAAQPQPTQSVSQTSAGSSGTTPPIPPTAGATPPEPPVPPKPNTQRSRGPIDTDPNTPLKPGYVKPTGARGVLNFIRTIGGLSVGSETPNATKAANTLRANEGTVNTNQFRFDNATKEAQKYFDDKGKENWTHDYIGNPDKLKKDVESLMKESGVEDKGQEGIRTSKNTLHPEGNPTYLEKRGEAKYGATKWNNLGTDAELRKQYIKDNGQEAWNKLALMDHEEAPSENGVSYKYRTKELQKVAMRDIREDIKPEFEDKLRKITNYKAFDDIEDKDKLYAIKKAVDSITPDQQSILDKIASTKNKSAKNHLMSTPVDPADPSKGNYGDLLHKTQIVKYSDIIRPILDHYQTRLEELPNSSFGKEEPGTLPEDRKFNTNPLDNYFNHHWEVPEGNKHFQSESGVIEPNTVGKANFLKERDWPTYKSAIYDKKGNFTGRVPSDDNPITSQLKHMAAADRYITGKQMLEDNIKDGTAEWVKTGESPSQGRDFVPDELWGDKSLGGRWAIPKDEAAVLQRSASAVMHGQSMLDWYKRQAGFINAVNLGGSLVHLKKTLFEASRLEAGTGLKQFINNTVAGGPGKTLKGAMQGIGHMIYGASKVGTAVQVFKEGTRLKNEMINSLTKDQPLETRAILKGVMDSDLHLDRMGDYKNKFSDAIRDAVHSPETKALYNSAITEGLAKGKVLGAINAVVGPKGRAAAYRLARAVPSAMAVALQPINEFTMSNAVIKSKLLTFAQMFKLELDLAGRRHAGDYGLDPNKMMASVIGPANPKIGSKYHPNMFAGGMQNIHPDEFRNLAGKVANMTDSVLGEKNLDALLLPRAMREFAVSTLRATSYQYGTAAIGTGIVQELANMGIKEVKNIQNGVVGRQVVKDAVKAGYPKVKGVIQYAPGSEYIDGKPKVHFVPETTSAVHPGKEVVAYKSPEGKYVIDPRDIPKPVNDYKPNLNLYYGVAAMADAYFTSVLTKWAFDQYHHDHSDDKDKPFNFEMPSPTNTDFLSINTHMKDPRTNEDILIQDRSNYIRDYVQFFHDPASSLSAKEGEVISSIGEIAHNRQFSGETVYDPHSSLLDKVGDTAKYAAGKLLPFSISNVTQLKDHPIDAMRQGQSPMEPKPGDLGWQMDVANALGYPKAPAWMKQSEALKIASGYQSERVPAAGRTPEAMKKANARKDIIGQFRKMEPQSKDYKAVADNAIKQGFTDAQINSMWADSRLTPLQILTKPRDLDQAFEILRKATGKADDPKSELGSLREIIGNKLDNADDRGVTVTPKGVKVSELSKEFRRIYGLPVRSQ